MNEKITEILAAHGVAADACKMFEKYYEMLIDWNSRINLTAITDETEVAYKHFLDCIGIFDCGVIGDGAKVIDVGTGAGFPGIPMKIVKPALRLTLLDSLNKRINFLGEVVSELGLGDIECVHARAEDAARQKELREGFDACVSRAVANLSTLSELCLPFVRVGGYFVAMKGPKADEEISAAKKAVRLLGGEMERIVSYKTQGFDFDHNMVVIKKIAPTAARFPRKAPKPSKEPLG